MADFITEFLKEIKIKKEKARLKKEEERIARKEKAKKEITEEFSKKYFKRKVILKNALKGTVLGLFNYYYVDNIYEDNYYSKNDYYIEMRTLNILIDKTIYKININEIYGIENTEMRELYEKRQTK